MHKFLLFVSPGTCARVPTIALEEIGVPFETQLVRMADKQHKSPEFLRINPKGKVPALAINGAPLTENVAILTWLHRSYPEAKLLPSVTSDLMVCQQTADLSFFSSTMHPLVTRIARPENFVVDGIGKENVSPPAENIMRTYLKMIDERLAGQSWWYTEQWSVVDAYLFWVWWRIGIAGFDGSDYGNIIDHERRMLERPAVARSMAREKVHFSLLKELSQNPRAAKPSG